MKCPKCGAEVSKKFCRNCGSPVSVQERAAVSASICPSCGTNVRPEAKYCFSCGDPLIRSVTPPAVSASGNCERCGAPLSLGSNSCISCGQQVSLSGSRPYLPRVQSPVSVLSRDQLPVAQPVATGIAVAPAAAKAYTPQTVSQKLSEPNPQSWIRRRGLLLSALVIIIVGAAALGYWFVVRKPTVAKHTIIEAQQYPQPSAPVQNNTTAVTQPTQNAQPFTGEPQEAAGEAQSIAAAPVKPSRENPQPPTVDAEYSQETSTAIKKGEQRLFGKRFSEVMGYSTGSSRFVNSRDSAGQSHRLLVVDFCKPHDCNNYGGMFVQDILSGRGESAGVLYSDSEVAIYFGDYGYKDNLPTEVRSWLARENEAERSQGHYKNVRYVQPGDQ